MDPSLPGHEIVAAGLEDLASGRVTRGALLVSMAAERLCALGFAVDSPHPEPEIALYRLLAAELGDGAHSKYNAYRRQLASFLRAASCANPSTPSASDPS